MIIITYVFKKNINSRTIVTRFQLKQTGISFIIIPTSRISLVFNRWVVCERTLCLLLQNKVLETLNCIFAIKRLLLAWPVCTNNYEHKNDYLLLINSVNKKNHNDLLLFPRPENLPHFLFRLLKLQMGTIAFILFKMHNFPHNNLNRFYQTNE